MKAYRNLAHCVAALALATVLVSVPARAQEQSSEEIAKARAKQVSAWKKIYGEGPYPDEIDAFVASKPEALKPLFKTLYTGGERNAVLNFERLGLAAIETGHWDIAKKSFDAALLRIETIYAKNAQAEAARSIFHKEANKDYKGEPYERAMAYYYRGLLFLRDGDYSNARATFKMAEYQDTVSEDEQYQGDFALMDYLMGWASHCEGQKTAAEDAFAFAAKTQAGLPIPAANANTLFIAELARGPLKIKDGKQKEKMVFQAVTDYPETGARFIVNPAKGQPLTLNGSNASSVYFQATTRGGRAIDGILAGKASWKNTTQTIGDGATQGGLALMRNSFSGGYGNSDTATAGAVMAGAGLMFKAFSSAMKADADIRAWDGLPDNILVATANLADPMARASVKFTNGSSDMEISGLPVVQSKAGRCAIAWTRSRSVMSLPEATPGDDANVATAARKKKDVAAKDKAFRVTLEAL